MDPITTALIAALTKLTEPAIKDAYEGLKALIIKKFGSHHEVVRAVENLEKRPDSLGRRETLQEEVAGSKAGEDTAISSAAHSLLESLKKQPGGPQTVQQIVTGNRNIFSGTGDIHIGEPKP
jgi:hypothetical protein